MHWNQQLLRVQNYDKGYVTDKFPTVACAQRLTQAHMRLVDIFTHRLTPYAYT